MVAELAAKLKEEGNAAFKAQKYLAAAALYTKALKNDSGTNDAATAILYRRECVLPAGRHACRLPFLKDKPRPPCPPLAAVHPGPKPFATLRVDVGAATGAPRC
jgi:hypothetical protein